MGRRSMTSHGRRKIEIKKIQSEDARHVCFSKRKSGIFAKASDISTLCGADVALLIYSPAGNPYSFGSPAVQPIVDRFLSGKAAHTAPSAGGGGGAYGNPSSCSVQQLNVQFMDLAKKLDASRETKMKLRERLDASVLSEEWAWANSIDNLGFDQLDRLKDGFEWLKGNAEARIKEILSSGHKMQLQFAPPAGAGGGGPPHPPPPPPPAPSSFPLWTFGSMHLVPNQFDESGPFPIHLAGNRVAYMHDHVGGF